MRTRARYYLVLIALLMSVGPAFQVASAQDEGATPLTDLGLPELEVAVTTDGASALPDEIEAGRYRVVVNTDIQAVGGVDFIYLPEDVSEEQLMADAQSESPPAWWYTTHIAGGVPLVANDSSDVIMDLPPGDLIVMLTIWEGEAEAGPPQFVTVTGDASAIESAPVPQADVELQLADMSFTLSGSVPSGTSTWQVTNNGAQPHEVSIVQAPDGTTVEQVLAIDEAFMSGGTPSPDLPNPEDFVPVGGVGVISDGTTVWDTIDLEPGTYVLMCYVPDPETGLPHIMLGMIDVIEVE